MTTSLLTLSILSTLAIHLRSRLAHTIAVLLLLDVASYLLASHPVADASLYVLQKGSSWDTV